MIGPQGVGLTCVSGFTSHSGGRLCMSDVQAPSSILDSITSCRSQGMGSRVCTLNDFHQACGSVSLGHSENQVHFVSTVGWTGDMAFWSSGVKYYGTRNGNCEDGPNIGDSDYSTNPTNNFSYNCCY